MFGKSLIATTTLVLFAFLAPACSDGEATVGEQLDLREIEFVPGMAEGPCKKQCEMVSACGLQELESCVSECNVVPPSCMSTAAGVLNCKRHLTCEELAESELYCGDEYIAFGMCVFGEVPQ
ncbi:MAG: hypothetical protein KC457_29080 [Myxococcales bacterium]|nr:hypothetical protein [Myxococcales bacterium]